MSGGGRAMNDQHTAAPAGDGETGSGEHRLIGQRLPQLGSLEKVTGQARYTDDLRLHNPLWVKILRSPRASARIERIDTAQARAIDGVRSILTGEDFEHRFGVLPISRDEPPLARDWVNYVGEPVAAVAAETEAAADAALRAIVVEYLADTPCLDPRKSLKPVARPIHPELERDNNLHKRVEQCFGDPEAGFGQAEVLLNKRFSFAPVTHGFTEPHATQVAITPDGELTVYSATQVPHYLHRALAEVLGIDAHRIRVIKPHLGGGFGGKSDPFPHEIIAARMALETGRNVRLRFNREEIFFSNHGRHPTEITMQLGYHRDKGITALSNNATIDGGAYGSFGVVTTYYNGVLLQGPYKLPNYRFECRRVYTNKPMCGAMRGHGGVNPRFASEVLVDMALTEAGQDPVDGRLAMILDENSLTPNEFRVTSVGIRRGLENAMAQSGWRDKYGQLPFGRGIGVACGFFISGSALPIHRNEMPGATVRLTIDLDGGVTVYSGAADIGQGSDTILAMMAAEVLGLPLDWIKVVSADTRLTPIDLGSYSSRVTFMCGNAARNAAIRMRRRLVEAACELLGLETPPYPEVGEAESYFRQGGRKPDFAADDLGANPDFADGFEFADGAIGPAGDSCRVDYLAAVEKALARDGILQTRGSYRPPKMGGTFKGAGAGLSPSYSFTAHIAEVAVDPDTGLVRVERITCAHDCGRPLNRLAVEGQIEGSIHMGLGQALMEEMNYDQGAVQNPSLLEYKMLSAFEQPEIDIVDCYSDESEGPFGGKEAGEGVLAPVAPAVANAIFDAVGIRLTRLPMTPDLVVKALARQRKAGAA